MLQGSASGADEWQCDTLHGELGTSVALSEQGVWGGVRGGAWGGVWGGVRAGEATGCKIDHRPYKCPPSRGGRGGRGVRVHSSDLKW